MDKALSEHLAAERLPELLRRMGLIGAQLQVELSRLEAHASGIGPELEKLRDEMDQLGWLLSVLSAAGEGKPGMARHHPRGLEILFGFVFGQAALAKDLLPRLEAEAGPATAWSLAVWLHALQPNRIKLAASRQGTWLLTVTAKLLKADGEILEASQALLGSETIQTSRDRSGQLVLELPGGWFHLESEA